MKKMVKLLSGIACGRGQHLADDSSLTDERDSPEVVFVRVMHEFTAKEIALYNKFQEVGDPCVAPTFSTAKDPLFSIRRLTQDFILNLQQDFPSTVPTVLRMSNKLERSERENTGNCLLCACVLDTTEEDGKGALQATEFSQLVSLKGPSELSQELLTSPSLLSRELGTTSQDCANLNNTVECCGEGDGSCRSSSSEGMKDEEVKSHLCYSCRVVCSKTSRLPGFVYHEAARIKRRQNVKASIQQFLL